MADQRKLYAGCRKSLLIDGDGKVYRMGLNYYGYKITTPTLVPTESKWLR